LARGLPLPGVPSPPVARPSEPELKLPSDAEVDKVISFLEKAWRRLLEFLPREVSEKIAAAEKLAHVRRTQHFTVARFEDLNDRISLLNYPDFFEDGFPALHESWLVDLTTGRVSYRTYRDSLTPPILHRKELILAEDHPRRAEFQALTEAAEAIGLFHDSTRIGFREQWLRLVREKGYQIVGQVHTNCE
jgi:DNA phosphorothioation-associated putative methyltransferase